MKPKYRIGLLISILLSALLLVVTTSASRAQSPRKQVLVIHSYHIGYKWTDDLMLGIRNVFQDEGNVDLRVEYFDTKRISDEEYIKLIVELFKKKYQNTGIDLVLSTDDAALNFLLDYADELFPKTPVAFAGANYFDETRLVGHDQFTGISEEADLSGTLDTALAIHPNVNRVIVVND